VIGHFGLVVCYGTDGHVAFEHTMFGHCGPLQIASTTHAADALAEALHERDCTDLAVEAPIVDRAKGLNSPARSSAARGGVDSEPPSPCCRLVTRPPLASPLPDRFSPGSWHIPLIRKVVLLV
jgi:hypothetical protein